MRITTLFQKPITRPINGVVKADQLDASSVWQELDEFVVTRELDRHLRTFFSAYGDAIAHPHDPTITGKMGVWVSGFFGSGKSHFLKVLSYLLRNDRHTYQGQTKQAVAFFEPKITDAMLLGDIKRAVASQTDVILFNIDSKADTKAGRAAILSVFLKVLNEMQGYCPDHPHIAHMERYLDTKGTLATFQQAFREASGLELGAGARRVPVPSRRGHHGLVSSHRAEHRHGRKMARWCRRAFRAVRRAFLSLGEGLPRYPRTRPSPHLPGG